MNEVNLLTGELSAEDGDDGNGVAVRPLTARCCCESERLESAAQRF